MCGKWDQNWLNVGKSTAKTANLNAEDHDGIAVTQYPHTNRSTSASKTSFFQILDTQTALKTSSSRLARLQSVEQASYFLFLTHRVTKDLLYRVQDSINGICTILSFLIQCNTTSVKRYDINIAKLMIFVQSQVPPYAITLATSEVISQILWDFPSETTTVNGPLS